MSDISSKLVYTEPIPGSDAMNSSNASLNSTPRFENSATNPRRKMTDRRPTTATSLIASGLVSAATNGSPWTTVASGSRLFEMTFTTNPTIISVTASGRMIAVPVMNDRRTRSRTPWGSSTVSSSSPGTSIGDVAMAASTHPRGESVAAVHGPCGRGSPPVRRRPATSRRSVAGHRRHGGGGISPSTGRGNL